MRGTIGGQKMSSRGTGDEQKRYNRGSTTSWEYIQYIEASSVCPIIYIMIYSHMDVAQELVKSWFSHTDPLMDVKCTVVLLSYFLQHI